MKLLSLAILVWFLALSVTSKEVVDVQSSINYEEELKYLREQVLYLKKMESDKHGGSNKDKPDSSKGGIYSSESSEYNATTAFIAETEDIPRSNKSAKETGLNVSSGEPKGVSVEATTIDMNQEDPANFVPSNPALQITAGCLAFGLVIGSVIVCFCCAYRKSKRARKMANKGSRFFRPTTPVMREK